MVHVFLESAGAWPAGACSSMMTLVLVEGGRHLVYDDTCAFDLVFGAEIIHWWQGVVHCGWSVDTTLTGHRSVHRWGGKERNGIL